MHTPVLFEHPLNEKMRTWLRIEFLIQQMAFHPQIASHADALHFFRNAGDLLDVLERGEVRTDLVKELERQQRKLQSWAEVPGVDQERINELRHQLKQSSSTLMAAPRIGQFLREDRLIALVRQRLSIPGGCCSFDLPTLHIWLHMPQAHRGRAGGQLACQPRSAGPVPEPDPRSYPQLRAVPQTDQPQRLLSG
ncbi:Protein of uncharacterised function (DUF1342) [Klebsiella pneumoniae]|nr:Protein of uncharacterised function (DUF1342) [Klebsiella pneumoniae]